MTRQLLFVQGGGAGTHDEWDIRLVESLRGALGPEVEIRYPRMPNEDDPSYGVWREALEKEFTTLEDGAILVGHSLGATVLVSALAERPPKRRFAAIMLVAAPFVGEGGWPSEDIQLPWDLGVRLPEGVPVFIFHGLDDDTAPPSHAGLYARAIPWAHVRLLHGRDHQLNDDLTEVAATIGALERRA